MIRDIPVLLVLALCATVGTVSTAAQRNFVADATFTGSALDGWKTIGDAEWRAANGVITGRPGRPGGWLIHRQAWPGAQTAGADRCARPCEAGAPPPAASTP